MRIQCRLKIKVYTNLNKYFSSKRKGNTKSTECNRSEYFESQTFNLVYTKRETAKVGSENVCCEK